MNYLINPDDLQQSIPLLLVISQSIEQDHGSGSVDVAGKSLTPDF